jgi:hypothetical protein
MTEWWDVHIGFDLDLWEGVFLYFDQRILSEWRQINWYDPMAWQLVVKWKDREDSRKKLIEALDRLEILWLDSNKNLCLAILKSKEFKNNTHNSKSLTIPDYIEKTKLENEWEYIQDKINKDSDKNKEQANKIIAEKELEIQWLEVKANTLTVEIAGKANEIATPRIIHIYSPDSLLEDILKWGLIDWISIENNWNGYDINFTSESKIIAFEWYLQWIWLNKDTHSDLFKKLWY